jgi:DNA-binding NarL/FixJ family response regulator
MSAKPNPYLSEREREVVVLMCEGLEGKEIARETSLSPKTIQVHKAKIYKKAGVKNVAQLVMWAVRNRVVAP